MKKSLLLLSIIFEFSLFIVLFTSCKKNDNSNNNYVTQYNYQKLKETGKFIYNKNCLECHGNITANGNNIRRINYDFNFLKNYITKQDSLLSIKDEKTLMIKQNYKDNDYIHKFNLTYSELKALQLHLNK